MQRLFQPPPRGRRQLRRRQVLGPRGDDGEWLTVEVATFRSDGAYTDGRQPDAVVFSSPEEDAQRRDFTINGMFFDPVEGRADRLRRRPGRPRRRRCSAPSATRPQRFAEDKLRMLRAVRIAARFDLAIDPATLAAVRADGRAKLASSQRSGSRRSCGSCSRTPTAPAPSGSCASSTSSSRSCRNWLEKVTKCGTNGQGDREPAA